MSDHKDQKENQGYSLDDILAEYGTGRYQKKSKVVEFPQEEESDTLGGLVFAQLSVIPEDGAQIEVDAHGLHIQVLGFADRRVEWALVSKPEQPEEVVQET